LLGAENRLVFPKRAGHSQTRPVHWED